MTACILISKYLLSIRFTVSTRFSMLRLLATEHVGNVTSGNTLTVEKCILFRLCMVDVLLGNTVVGNKYLH